MGGTPPGSAGWLDVGLVLLGSALAAGLIYRALRASPRRKLAWLPLLLWLAVAGSTVAWANHRVTQSKADLALAKKTPQQDRADEYVTSAQCQACHPDQYASWYQTFHRTMTQYPSRETVIGDFNNVDVSYAGQKIHLTQRDGGFFTESRPEAAPPDAKPVVHQVTLLTGSHHMQAYWVASSNGNAQTLFPMTWWKEEQRWVPFRDTFLRDPGYGHTAQTWNINCMNCHATAGQPRPTAKANSYETRVGEMGIACEACHSGAYQHAKQYQSPVGRYRARMGKETPAAIVNPAKLDHKASSQVCGQCHGIHWIQDRNDWLRYGFSFRPGRDLTQSGTPLVRPRVIDELPWLAPALKRAPTFLDDHFWNDGVARVSGRDFSSMMESKCFLQGELSCLSCHTMHHGDRTNQLQTIAFNNDACLQCHQTLRAKLTEHTHHAADSSGSSCYNCHMPYTTYGLMKAIRSHYIASPSVTNTLSTGRPNACNLCHLDKTLAWTANTLEQWRTHSTNATAPAEVMDRLNVEYRQTSAAVIDLLRGDAGQRALAAWSFGWEPARKASGEDWLAASLAPLLEDPYATVRYIAGRSLKRLPGYADFKYDYIAGAGERAAARAKALAQWPGAKSTPSRPSLLLDPAGKLDEARLNDLLSRRDNKRMDLQE